MLKIGIIGFRTIVILTNFNAFENLSLAKRQAIVKAWSFGKIGLTRKLFKPLRSIALLAYFEDEGVQSALQAERQA